MKNALLMLLAAIALIGCSSLHNAYEVDNRQTGLNFATCEGKFSQNTGDNYIFRYRILEGIEYKGANAMKVEVQNVIGGVGYEMSIYDVFDRADVEVLSYIVDQEGRRRALQTVKNDASPDVVVIESQLGRVSLPGGAYDISKFRDLSDVRGIQEAGGDITNQALQIFDEALYDAAVKMKNGNC